MLSQVLYYFFLIDYLEIMIFRDFGDWISILWSGSSTFVSSVVIQISKMKNILQKTNAFLDESL